MIRTGLIVSGIAIAVMAGVSIWAGGQLPAENIPVHWNADGAADRFAGRQEALAILWLIPGVALFCALLLALLPQIEPMRENLLKSRKAYIAAWVASALLLGGVHIGMTLLMLQSGADDGASIEFVRFVIAGTGILFIVLGNYMPKTRQNWFLGIRTPWTLSSEYTWEKTHRLGGRLFMLVGFVSLIGAFVLNGISLAFMLAGGAVGAALTCAVFSFLVYRNAPDKRISPDYIV